MRSFLSAVLLCSPLALSAVATTPARADSAIGEVRATEAPPADAAPAAAAQDATPAPRAERSTRRHRVAGSHYERERLRSSQIHG